MGNDALVAMARAQVSPIQWDAFVFAHPMGWFWHTAGWLEYGGSFPGDREDLSFAVLNEDGRIVGLCPLIREGDRCAFEGEPGAWYLSVDAGYEKIIDELKAIGRPFTFRSCPLVEKPVLAVPALAQIGWYSRVLDLTPSEATLHAGLRKSYKGLINRAGGCEIAVDRAGELAADYKDVHLASIGQIAPRPARTYALQALWMAEGNAFLVGARRAGQWVAFVYVFVYKQAAYYGSGPSLAPSVMHALLWRAILEAKALGCERFEVGWQGHAKSDKDRGIERFKAGFGGLDVPVWVMEV